MAKKKKIASEAAKTLSVLGASKGGVARANALTPAERSEIARRAVEARWAKVKQIDQPDTPTLRATHSGVMAIGNVEIPCFVLENETRVISHRALQRSLGRAASGGAHKTAILLGAIEDKIGSTKDLAARISAPLQFYPAFGGRSAFGYEAVLLADICEVVLEARRNGFLTTKGQHQIASQCEILLGGFARIGIIALVDEATGYQYSRARDDLRKILAKYVSKELARWERTFDKEFYEHLHRLKRWPYDPNSTQRSHACAYYTVDLTYKRIHPELLKELKAARTDGDKPNSKLHQWLTTDPSGGHPRLKQHLEGVVSLMSVAEDWEQFQNWVDRRYPRLNDTLRIPFPEMDGKDLPSTENSSSTN